MSPRHTEDTKARLARAGVTLTELAPLVGIEYTALSHILSGRRSPPADFAFRVDDALAAIEKARAAYRAVLVEHGYEVAS